MSNHIRAVIVDNEPAGANVLRILLQDFCPSVEVVEVCHDARKSIGIIQQLQPQVVFLDVEMPHADGFQVLELVRDKVGHVIFTTAHSHYAIQAVRAAALDYLVKPIDPDELIRAVARIPAPAAAPVVAPALAAPVARPLARLAIQGVDGYLMVDYDDIIRLEADSNYTQIHCTQKRHVVARLLSSFEAQLEPMGFIRVHNTHIVNLKHVLHYQRGDGGFVQLTGDVQVEVSRSRKKALIKALLGE